MSNSVASRIDEERSSVSWLMVTGVPLGPFIVIVTLSGKPGAALPVVLNLYWSWQPVFDGRMRTKDFSPEAQLSCEGRSMYQPSISICIRLDSQAPGPGSKVIVDLMWRAACPNICWRSPVSTELLEIVTTPPLPGFAVWSGELSSSRGVTI